MWIAKFKLKDDEDIYSPLCIKHKIELFAIPLTNFEKNKKINLLLSAIISGKEENKKQFLKELKKDKRVKKVEYHHDFLIIHAQHPISREARAEIKIFYNPQYIQAKPIHLSTDGWEYWEIACLDRNELNKIISAACKHYHGKLFSIKEETLKNITSHELMPSLTPKQFETLQTAFKQGYYNYPRKLTIQQLAKQTKKSYTTFQEHLRKAENKLISYFLKYR
jgi:predicted DNA binding protein